MAKQTKNGTTAAPLEITQFVPTPEIYSNKAFGVTRNPVNQQWCTVCITYDLVTGQASKPEIIESNLDREVINDSFKIKVSDAGILG